MCDSPIPFKMPPELHSWVCRIVTEMDKNKSQVMRACVLHSMDSILHTPGLVKCLNATISEEEKDPSINFKIPDPKMRGWFEQSCGKLEESRSAILRACVLLALPVIAKCPTMVDDLKFIDRIQ
jgi:hypothetical protein